MHLDILGIQAFLAIVERGSFQKAALDLNISPTALSHRIRKFESDIGQKLIERTTREITLTRAGNDILPQLRKSLDELHEVMETVRHRGGDKQTSLAFGCLPTIADTHLGTPLLKFITRHPDVAIRIYDNSAREIAELIAAGSADFGITILGTGRWDFEAETLLREPFYFACAPHHPLASCESVTWAQIAAQPLIRVSRLTGNRALIDGVLRGRREEMSWLYEVQHNHTSVSLVAAGVGSAILPALAVPLAMREAIRLVPLRQPSVNRTIGLIWKKGEPLSPLALEFRELLIAELSSSVVLEDALNSSIGE